MNIVITADTNDADFVTKSSKITEYKLKKIQPVIEAIKKFKPYKNKGMTHDHNFPNGEMVREDLGEKTAEDMYGHLKGFQTFLDMCPYGEVGIHTIEHIELVEVKKILFNNW